MLKSFWTGPLVRASYDSPLTRGETIGYAGFPNRDLLDAGEMSIIHVETATTSHS